MKAIFFDVDDTLYDQTQAFCRAYQKVFGDKYPQVVPSELCQIMRKYADKVYDQYLNKEITLEQSYIYRIQQALAYYQVEVDDQKCLEFQDNYVYFQNYLDTTDVIKQVLSMAKEKALIGILSNGPGQHQRDKIKTLKLLDYVDEKDIFISGEINVAKPDKKAFDHVMVNYDFKEEDYLYIGDNYKADIIGSYNVGWKTIWFNRRHNVVPDDCVADYIVNSEEELLELMNKLR